MTIHSRFFALKPLLVSLAILSLVFLTACEDKISEAGCSSPGFGPDCTGMVDFTLDDCKSLADQSGCQTWTTKQHTLCSTTVDGGTVDIKGNGCEFTDCKTVPSCK